MAELQLQVAEIAPPESESRPRRLRALFIAYQFPPTGGVGCIRVAKLCKYLPEHGIVPTVVTASNPSVPLVDHSLLAELGATEVVRVPTLEPGYRVKQAAWSARALSKRSLRRALFSAVNAALVPDPQILWQPAAQLATLRRLRDGFDVVFISGPPFSQFLVGPLARLHPGCAVVLDYRDEWSTYRAGFEMMGRLQALTGALLEPALVRSAHLVTVATEAFRTELLSRFPFLAPEQVVAITNGYDPDDYPAVLDQPPADRFVLTYAGTVYALNRSPGLLAAIRRLHRREPELASLLRVRFIGRIVASEAESFAGMDQLGVERLGFMSKADALRAQAASHMTLCMFDDRPGTDRMYAGKIFELMYLGRPVLTLAPPGVMTRLAQRHRLGPVAGPRDEEAIYAILVRSLRRFRAGRYRVRSAATGIERYHRRQTAQAFASAFREAVRRARA